MNVFSFRFTWRKSCVILASTTWREHTRTHGSSGQNTDITKGRKRQMNNFTSIEKIFTHPLSKCIAGRRFLSYFGKETWWNWGWDFLSKDAQSPYGCLSHLSLPLEEEKTTNVWIYLSHLSCESGQYLVSWCTVWQITRQDWLGVSPQLIFCISFFIDTFRIVFAVVPGNNSAALL